MKRFLPPSTPRGPGIACRPRQVTDVAIATSRILPGARKPKHFDTPLSRITRISLLLAAPLLLLSSCIDSREEIWLHPSGSGSARITVSLPSSAITLRGGPDAVSTSIDGVLAQQPGVTSIKKHITTADNRSTIDVSFQFASALELSSSMAKSATDPNIPAPVRHFMGMTSLQHEGLALTGERVIDVGKAIPGSAFLSSAATNHRLLTILHLPLAPTDHNATRVENEGRTLIWEIPLATAMRTPFIQRVHVRAPAPLLAGISISASLLLTVAILIWRKRRKLRTAATPVITEEA